MAKTKEQKVEIVRKLEEAFKNASATVFVHFKGINISEETEMRRSLRGEGVKYAVAKKTLMRRALEGLGHDAKSLPLEGEVAVAYGEGEDATAPARLINEFGKKFADKLSILGGIFEGKLVGQGTMQQIATIPGMQGLRGMFANVINSPMQRFAIALSEVAKTKTQ